MTDTTAARRQLLALLLDRVEYGNLLDAERPLLRPLVLAEQGAADAATTPDDDPDARLRRITDALTAEHYRRAEQQIVASPEEHSAAMAAAALVALDGRHWRGTDGIDMATAYMDAQATLARVHRAMATPPELPYDSLYDRGWTDAMSAITRALDGPSPTPDDAPSCQDSEGCHRVVPCDPGCATHPARATPTTSDDAQATADRAALDNAIAGLAEQASDRAVYGDRTGQMLGVLAGSQAPGTLARCSPLVNADCPGHTGPPYCDRAPSNPAVMATPPDWEQAVADQRRLFQATAGLSEPAYDDGPTGTCRVMETRTCPTSGPCGDQPCARFESPDPAPGTTLVDPLDDAPSEPQP